MPGALAGAEALIGVLVLVAAGLAFVVARRHLIARGYELLLCSLRVGADAPWHTGLLRLSHTHLEWFPLFGVTTRARYRWARTALEVGAPGPVPSDAPALAAGSSRLVGVSLTSSASGVVADRWPTPARVPASGEAERIDLVVGAEPYTAIRSWVESSPPPDWRMQA